MHPILTTLSWHGVTRPVGSYGALLALALLVGSALLLRAGARAGLEQGAVISALACAIGLGFVGAYACSVLVLWPQLGSHSEALARPGIVFYGGLAGGAAGLVLAARRFGLPVLVLLDCAVPALPVAHAIGRIGCWLGGCCYGAESQLPWAVRYPAESVTRHPWPLYECACLLLMAAVCGRGEPFARPPGRRAAPYLLCYALLRLPLELLRGDRVRGLLLHGGLSVSQLLSIGALLVSIAWLRHGTARHAHA
jgi:phosphatidylglycerol:prolipoprotein diacylglycerol transferase